MLLHRRRFGSHAKRASTEGSHASIFLVCGMFFFWTMSEGLVSFIVPLQVEQMGFSSTMLGVILATSSVAGAAFDLFACRVFKTTFYKRTFAFMFVLCLAFPLIIMHATTALTFLFGMVIWGIYYDLRNIGNFDYVARTTKKENSASAFGLIQMVQSFGWIAGPILVGFLIGKTIGWYPFAAIYLFLGVALLFFLALYAFTGNRTAKIHSRAEEECKRGTWSEFSMLSHIGIAIMPTLIAVLLLNFADSFFWTVGPLFAEQLNLGVWAGLFVTLWSLPTLLLSWYAGTLVLRFGKIWVARISQIGAALCLLPIAFVSSHIGILIAVSAAACFTAIAWPSVQSIFGDYIQGRDSLGKEVEGLEDLYTNIGYIIGPLCAGLLADYFGYHTTFALLGVIVVVVLGITFIIWRKPVTLTAETVPLICDA